MSRSYRHTPVVGWTNAKSDKLGKVHAHGQLRAATRAALANCRDFDALIMPLVRETSNVWDFEKDGKMRLSSDHRYYAKLMRK